jgi:type IV pilus assembly protein PilE
MRNRQRGVTLIELMTVVVVIAILASVAIPSYRRHLLRAQRSDAMTAVLKVQSALEKRYLQQGSFTNNLTAAPPTGLGTGNRSEQGYYDLAVDLANPNTTGGYLITATPRTGGGQTSDTTCASFTINANSTKKAYNSGSTDKTSECWR